MILVVSYPEDEHTSVVKGHLARAGREVVQLDLLDFPWKSPIRACWSDNEEARFLIDQQGRWVDINRAKAVWWRRVHPFQVDRSITKEEHRAFVVSETSQAVNGILDSLRCSWINPREADAAAHHKPYQWTVAQRLGLKLPRTLVTTDIQAAREFVKDIGLGRVVFKAFLASIQEWRETRLIEKEDLDQLDLVRYAPVIFQEYIPGVDLRITVVGDKLFAAEIDARKSSYPVDMRMVVGESQVKAVNLPGPVETLLHKLMRRLNLVYGAIDMRRTEEGDYRFLEVNPAGQWLFIENRTEQPIAQAVADLLGELQDKGFVGGA